MLARALALNPKVLLLDDFTARVDTTTERKILRERPPELSGHHADLGHAEDRLRRGLRPDRAADGRRGAGLRNAPATDGNVARNTSRSMTRSEAPATTKYTLETGQSTRQKRIAAQPALKRFAPLMCRREAATSIVAVVAMLVSSGRHAGRPRHHRPRRRHLHPEGQPRAAARSSRTAAGVYLRRPARQLCADPHHGQRRPARAVQACATALFTKLQELPLDFFNQNKAGDLISRINNDTDKLNQFFAQALVQLVGNLFLMTGAAVFFWCAQRPARPRGAGAGGRRVRVHAGHRRRG